jgi:hypothetical protein
MTRKKIVRKRNDFAYRRAVGSIDGGAPNGNLMGGSRRRRRKRTQPSVGWLAKSNWLPEGENLELKEEKDKKKAPSH